jgi:hypothetical protein
VRVLKKKLNLERLPESIDSLPIALPMITESKSIHELLNSFLSRPSPTRVAAWLNELIDHCERIYPHSDWAELRLIDFESELPRLIDWFQTGLKKLTLTSDSAGCLLLFTNPSRPSGDIDMASLLEDMKAAIHASNTAASEAAKDQARKRFAQIQAMMLGCGDTTTDLEVAWLDGYNVAGKPAEWMESPPASPFIPAESAALHQLYEKSYKTRNPLNPVPQALGNQAEWALGMAYAILVTRAIAEATDLSLHEGMTARIAFATGWSSGDIEFAGELIGGAWFTPKRSGSSEG